MDDNSLVILSGLIALLLTLAAAQDGATGTAPSAVVWSLGGSWTTSAAAIAALGSIAFLDESSDTVMVLFAFMLLLGPVLYRGFSGAHSAARPLFLVVGTSMAWATIAILWRVGQLMASVTRSELTTVPRLVINSIVIAAMLAAVASLYKAMQAAFSGDESSGGTWTLA
jgi:hypothetical protein